MVQHIVALMLEKDGKFLAEKRKESKKTCPGDIVFPGGKVKVGETNEQALIREMQEELGVLISGLKLVHQADFECEEKQRISWYECKNCKGLIQKNEAKELLWIEPYQFTYNISRDAISAFFKSK